MSAFSNNSRDSRGRSNGGKTRRNPRIDSSRRPSPFRSKSSRSKSGRGSNELRAEANSVFAVPSTGKTKKTVVDKTPNDVEPTESVESGLRLQVVLAAAGYGSRRQCEELIQDGRVDVDGKTVSELGVRVSPSSQKIRVDGEALPKLRPVYLALNKPKNALCTNSDPQGRRRVGELIPREFGRLFPVGRLDQNSEGLLLLTNDGALAERLTHPRFEVPKKYKVQVAGLVDFNLVRDLKRGVHIAEGVVQADEVVVKSRYKMSSILEITLKEGKNREIRRMLARLGHKVMQLQRVQIGPIKLGKMAPGEFRRLTTQEVAALYRASETSGDSERFDDAARDGESRRPAPIEISEILRRQEAEEEERAAKKGTKGAKSATGEKFGGAKKSFANSEPKRDFSSENRRDFSADRAERSERNRFSDRDRSERSDRSDRFARRAERAEFREEFRSDERRDDRRRVRREYDDETRTIGPRKFDRSESPERRDRFNDDASARREVRGFGGARPTGKRDSQRPSQRPPQRNSRGNSNGGGSRSGGSRGNFNGGGAKGFRGGRSRDK